MLQKDTKRLHKTCARTLITKAAQQQKARIELLELGSFGVFAALPRLYVLERDLLWLSVPDSFEGKRIAISEANFLLNGNKQHFTLHTEIAKHFLDVLVCFG